MNEAKQREWAYSPVPDGESFVDKDGNEVLGWHDRLDGQDPLALLAEFEAYAADEFDIHSLTLRPILARTASDVECRINGWEEGTFVRCTTRAKNLQPMWQIEVDPDLALEKVFHYATEQCAEMLMKLESSQHPAKEKGGGEG